MDIFTKSILGFNLTCVLDISFENMLHITLKNVSWSRYLHQTFKAYFTISAIYQIQIKFIKLLWHIFQYKKFVRDSFFFRAYSCFHFWKLCKLCVSMHYGMYQCTSIVRAAESLFKQNPVFAWKCCLYSYILVHQIW